MDRTRLQQMGLSATNVGQNVLIALSGSSQTAPAFWLDPQNGVVYNIVVQSPQYTVDSMDALLNIPVGAGGANAGAAAAAGQPGDAQPARQLPIVSRYNIAPASTCTSACRAPTWPAWPARCASWSTRSAQAQARQPVEVRGQVQTMQNSFIGLGVGLAMAIVLVYLLVVVNFQSWIDAAIIIAALPAALAGIAWMLFITGTTLSVPALTGAIMTMGVATANSILVVSFARQQREAGIRPLSGRAASRRRHPHPPGADDGAGHDHRHDPDGPGPGRRRRAERAAGPRRHRRPALRHRVHAAVRARAVRRRARVGLRPPGGTATPLPPSGACPRKLIAP
jgi:multidrug efflux pump subunit AcrB